MAINFQEKRKECKDRNYVLSSQETEDLVTLYYKCREDFLSAYHVAKEQIAFKASKDRYDLIQFDRPRLEANLAIYGELRWVLRTLERVLNIKPDKSLDDFELIVEA
jgi:methionine synthase II (cobalamin-independent)